jgi:hypothetical protein
MSFAKRVIPGLALAALLIVAQHAALAHWAEHVLDQGPFESHQGVGDKNFHSDLCAFHGAFDDLLSAVGSTPPLLRVASSAFEQHLVAFSSFVPTDLLIPASRGPPVPALLS